MRAAGKSDVLTIDALQKNIILSGLGNSTASAILQHGRLVELPLRKQIYEPEVPIEDVYFPFDSVLSVVTQMADGNQIEVGTIGREGTSAFPLIMGASATANDCYCQVPGTAARIPAGLFRELSSADNDFRQLLDRYLQAYVNMLGQMAACNRLHTVFERCARWLLMTRNRVQSNRIRLTHEYLAMMLGTQRSGVTIAAGTLQKAGFISYGHGVITVLDLPGLERSSCECYDVARAQFEGLLRHIAAHS